VVLEQILEFFMTIRVGMLILHPNIQFTMKMFLRMICDVFALLQKVAGTITANSTCLLVRCIA